jgi:hypothetical protein
MRGPPRERAVRRDDRVIAVALAGLAGAIAVAGAWEALAFAGTVA